MTLLYYLDSLIDLITKYAIYCTYTILRLKYKHSNTIKNISKRKAHNEIM